MKKYNVIVVFDKDKTKILFCKRTKDPYQGLYNFVGGKIEDGEDGMTAAYRELYEETGITSEDIGLSHFMDITYYYQDYILELYVGQLSDEPELTEETNPLLWLPLTEDFADPGRFAGDQNIAHIVNVALKCEEKNGVVDRVLETLENREKKIISFTEISSIDDNGIQLMNGESILFEDCVAVWQENFPDSVCVAVRDICADPPYFEFFTSSLQMPLRIVFDRKGMFSKSRNQEEFSSLRDRIKEVGYSTYDLS